MDKSEFTAQINLSQVDPDVSSYIYQQMVEFEPFITPETMVAVVAKDPMKLRVAYESEGKEFDPKKMRKLYRIAMILNESGATVEAEGLAEDLYEAIRFAKENLMKKLLAIQDNVVSAQDRIAEIQQAMAAGSGVH